MAQTEINSACWAEDQLEAPQMNCVLLLFIFTLKKRGSIDILLTNRFVQTVNAI